MARVIRKLGLAGVRRGRRGPHHPRPGCGQVTPLQWKRVGSGLPATPDMDLKISGSDTELLVGTFGRGIWEVTLPTAKNP